MGGDIWVESAGREGEGSRFCLTLPGVADAVRHA
jgi:signal transduction histidine kinase